MLSHPKIRIISTLQQNPQATGGKEPENVHSNRVCKSLHNLHKLLGAEGQKQPTVFLRAILTFPKHLGSSSAKGRHRAAISVGSQEACSGLRAALPAQARQAHCPEAVMATMRHTPPWLGRLPLASQQQWPASSGTLAHTTLAWAGTFGQPAAVASKQWHLGTHRTPNSTPGEVAALRARMWKNLAMVNLSS